MVDNRKKEVTSMTEKTYVFKFDSAQERDGKWAKVFVEQDGKRSPLVENGKEVMTKKEDVMKMLERNLSREFVSSARPLVDDAPYVSPSFKEGEIQATAFYFPSHHQQQNNKLNLLVELSRDDCLDDEMSYQSRLWKMSMGRKEKEEEPIVREDPQSKFSRRIENIVNKFQDLPKVKKVAVSATACGLALAVIAGSVGLSMHREKVRKEEARNRYHIEVGVEQADEDKTSVEIDWKNEDGEGRNYVRNDQFVSKEEPSISSIAETTSSETMDIPYMEQDKYESLRSNIENNIKDPGLQRQALDRLVQQAFTGSTQVGPHMK